MRRKTLLALTLTTCLTAPAAAESWYGIFNSDEVIAYADADSVSRIGNYATVGLMLSHDIGDYHKWTVELDCPGQKYRILSGANYGSKREYLSTPDFETGWVALDNTVLQTGQGFACDGTSRDSLVSDPFNDADEYWYYYYYDY
jgi:hypothetical protein